MVKYRVKAFLDNGKAVSSTTDLEGLHMFKGYIFAMRFKHYKAKVSNTFVCVVTAFIANLYLLWSSAQARKIDILVDL